MRYRCGGVSRGGEPERGGGRGARAARSVPPQRLTHLRDAAIRRRHPAGGKGGTTCGAKRAARAGGATGTQNAATEKGAQAGAPVREGRRIPSGTGEALGRPAGLHPAYEEEASTVRASRACAQRACGVTPAVWRHSAGCLPTFCRQASGILPADIRQSAGNVPEACPPNEIQ